MVGTSAEHASASAPTYTHRHASPVSTHWLSATPTSAPATRGEGESLSPLSSRRQFALTSAVYVMKTKRYVMKASAEGRRPMSQ